MTPTSFRDQVGELAKTNVAKAEAIVGQAFLTSSSGHWREKCARKLIGKMLEGEMPPREFYW